MIVAYYGEFLRFEDCENWIANALVRAGHPCVRLQRRGQFDADRVLRLLQTANADILLLSKTPDIRPDQLQYIKDRFRGLIVFWAFDWMRHPDNLSWYLPLAKIAHVCFQTDGWGDAGFYQDEGVRRIELHQGFCPDWHVEPLNVTDEEIAAYAGDVVFVGSTYTARRRALVAELKRYPGFRKFGSPEGDLWGRPFAIAMRHSKIVVGDNYTNDVGGYWSDRVYLALACGAFFVTADVPGLQAEFVHGLDLMVWKDFHQLHRIIRSYLEPGTDKYRRAIAGRGQAGTLRSHSYNHRVADFVRELSRVAEG